MAAIYAVLPALVVADFNDFVDNVKEAAKDTFSDKPATAKKTLSFGQHLATFWDRNSPRDFVLEFLGILLLVAIATLYFIGTTANEKLAKDKFKAIYRQLKDNFAQVGLSADSTPLVKDGPGLFESYVTGRKNVSYAHISISTRPRQDLLLGYPLRLLYGLFFDTVSIADRLTMDFSLPANYDGFVFGVLNKNVMRYQRGSNWDLTFTKTSDAPFSNHFVIMTEIAEVTEKVMTQEFTQVVVDLGDALEYLVVSDQPSKQPKTAEQHKTTRSLRFSILLGEASATPENLNLFLASVLNIVDSLPKQAGKVSVNGQKKLTQSREDTYRAIAKQIAAEEAVDAPKRLTRKEIRDKEKKEAIGKLSAKEQKRALEKERERAMKKGQGKMAKKG